MTEQPNIQRKANKGHRNAGSEGKNTEKSKKNVFEGANPNLAVFTYDNDRMSAEAFNNAKQTIIDYLNSTNPHAGYAVEHGVHYEFKIPDDFTIDATIKAKAEEQISKSVANYLFNELPEAYGVVFGQCDPGLRSALEESDDFMATIHNTRNLLKLWKQIESKCLNPIRSSDTKSSISNLNRQQAARSKFDAFYQLPRESVSDFYRRFETEVLAAESCGVAFHNEAMFVIALDAKKTELQLAALKRAEATPPATPAAADKTNKAILHAVKVTDAMQVTLKAGVRSRILAFEFIKKLNRAIYQDMQVELANRLNDGVDDYPVTVLEARRRAEGRVQSISRNNIPVQNSVAFTTANNHGNAGNKNNNKKNNQKGSNSNKNKNGPRSCYFCKSADHMQPECPLYLEAQQIYQARGDKKGDNNTKSFQAATIAEVSPSTEEVFDAGFCVVVQQSPSQETALVSRPAMLEDTDILLDNQATVSVFHYKQYLRNVRIADRPITIVGVGGQITATHVGDFGTFGAVYYHPSAVANILCFHDVAKHYFTSYDGDQNLFMIKNKTNGKEICFRNKNKLYVWNPRNTVEESILVQTVQDNMLRFTKREINASEEAKSAFIKLGRPSLKDFTELVRAGRLLNCPFTVKDIDRAIEIFGPDLGALKGRSVRTPPPHVKIEHTVMKSKVEDIILTGDIFYVYGLPFLVTQSRKLKLIVVQHLEDGKKAEAILQGFKSIMQVYNKHNFRISHFMSDTEAGLEGIGGELNQLGITYIPASKNQHVGEIERCIRQVKERCRAFVNTLPYLLTKLMIVHLVYFSVKMINSFPRDYNNESPRELLLGRKLDYKLDCKLEFGAYVQVNDDNSITNTMDSRTVGAICLGSSNDTTGSYMFLSLLTWRIITRGTWTTLPIPTAVIDVINQKAIEEDTKGHLKSHPIAKKFAKNTKSTKSKKNSAKNPAPAVAETESVESDISDDWSAVSDKSPKQRFEDYVTSSDEDVELTSDDDVSVVEEEEIVNNTVKEEFTFKNPSFEERWNDQLSTIFHSFGTVYNLSLRDTQEGLNSLEPKFVRRSNEERVVNEKSISAALTQMSVKAGIKHWGANAIVAAMDELRQLIMKDVFIFVDRKKLTPKQEKSILRTLLFVKEKRDGRLKGRCCVDGRPQAFLEQAIDPFSPTVSTETFLTSTVIDSHEEREVATADIEGAYLIVEMFDEEVFVDLDPVLTAIVVSMFPHLKKYVDEFGRLTARLGRALYGCIQSARMFYEHLKKNLLSFGFIPNPYEPCIFNKLSDDGKQVTITIYVDDVKISCTDPSVVDNVLDFLKKVYKTISIQRGKQLEYLGMRLNYEEKGKVKIDMINMIKEITSGLPEDYTKATTPASTNLFKIDSEKALLGADDKKVFHSMVAKLLYVAKRTRPDVLTPVSFLTTRVQDPTEDDLKKLNHVLRYLKSTCDLQLILECNDITQVTCYVDAAHYVHSDGKGHSGVILTMGKGAIYNSSRKQKLVSKSSTEAELIAISDGLSQAIWMRNLLKEQGYEMKPIKLFQDNQSTITLIKKGKSTSERTRHVDLRYFFVADRVKSKEVQVEYKPTKDMLADLHTKPLQGSLFRQMRGEVMNTTYDHVTPLRGCVEKKVRLSDKRVSDGRFSKSGNVVSGE